MSRQETDSHTPGAAEAREGTPGAELDRQVRRLNDLGYPGLAGLRGADFESLVEPLRDRLPAIAHGDRIPADAHGDRLPDDAHGDRVPDVADSERIPFVLVVRSSLVPTVDAVRRWSVRGKAGWTDMAAELPGYHPIEGIETPEDPVYLLLDVDTGADTLDVPPDDALRIIRRAGRSPITIDEGVALLTHFPAIFDERNAFQALGSRARNKRVPSFWVSKGAPRLGWCWAGNPHTWLGAASAAGRKGSG